MNVASLAIVVAALCVNFGWQPSPEDPQSYEVLMQVEPELLDVLQDGRQIPIESHVPAHVSPVRNIRVVVGTEELPRTSIAAKRNTTSNSDRVVRGQEPSPLEHTANFQGDDGWSGDRYPPGTSGGTRQFDQRGVSIGSAPTGTAETDPWTLDSAQEAATNAGNSLRNSVNSGVEQVNQQGQQLLNSAQNAGQDFGQQLQNMSGFNGQPTAPPLASPQSTAAGSRSPQSTWSAPPPLASPQSISSAPLSSAASSVAVTPNSWSSIRPELAPPRLATPTLAGGVRVASNPSTRASTGPSFPPPPTTGDTSRSLLAAPATTSNGAAEQDWSSVWGTNSTTSSTSGDEGGVGLVPVPPRPRNISNATPATLPANPTSGAPGVDRYGQSPPTAPPTNNGADAWANFGQPQNNNFDNRPIQQSPPPAAPSLATVQPTPVFAQPAVAQSTTPTVKTEEVPWKPLLGVSLALAGSVGANFFLGMSYADARRRYRSLVAKTTHAFQKEAGIAA